MVIQIDERRYKRLHLNLHCGCESWRPDLTTEQDMYDIVTQDVYSDLFESTLKRAKY